MENHVSEAIKEVVREKTTRLNVRSIIYNLRTSGMPMKYITTPDGRNVRGIPSSVVSDMLDERYHGGTKGVKNVISSIFEDVESLCRRSYILIDGGSVDERKKVGCAILFRLIACNMTGLYESCADLAHKLQTFKSTENMSRNEFSDSLKRLDSLFISEFRTDYFKEWAQSGEFLDAVLGYRSDHRMPTIVSFGKALSKANEIHDNVCGECMNLLVTKEFASATDQSANPTEEYLRIRVKSL